MNRKGQERRSIVTAVAWVAIGALAVGQAGCGRRGGRGRNKATALGCKQASRTPEVHSFYGSSKEVGQKLKQLDAKLADRNAYMYLVENDDSAELVLYRKAPAAEQWQAWRWAGPAADAGKIRVEAATRILKSRGYECVGKETQELVEGWKATPEAAQGHETAAAAFADVLDKYKDAVYINASLYLLC
jgi:hypothetical protein